MPVISITTTSEFESYITSSIERKFVFVDFYTTWCGPCKRIAPSIDTLSEIYTSIIFLKIDIESCKDLALKYNVTSIPTFMIFENNNFTPGVIIAGANYPKIEYALKLLTGNIDPSPEF